MNKLLNYAFANQRQVISKIHPNQAYKKKLPRLSRPMTRSEAVICVAAECEEVAAAATAAVELEGLADEDAELSAAMRELLRVFEGLQVIFAGVVAVSVKIKSAHWYRLPSAPETCSCEKQYEQIIRCSEATNLNGCHCSVCNSRESTCIDVHFMEMSRLKYHCNECLQQYSPSPSASSVKLNKNGR